MAMMLIATTGLLLGSAPVRPARSALCMGLHDLTAKAMDGTDIALNTLAGKKVIALNVASR